mmetsp:Transcript_19233/g.22239  ORF Transcript_19233/g.22239 Transcript_19233/m.22239 type:complete len:485 (+) Transcript_19233:120-1574(+)
MVEEKDKARPYAVSRQSTFRWISEGAKSAEKHENLVEIFERSYDQSAVVDPTLEPVHVLCIDGGGLKGYGFVRMIEAIQEKCKDRGSFCHQFDLVGGTSVGGISALVIGQIESTEEGTALARDILDDAREKTFKKINLIKVLTTGAAVNSENSLMKVFETRYGADTPLYNPDGVPSFVLSSTSGRKGGTSKRVKDVNDTFIEPFILRSYHYPEQEEEEIRNSNDFELAKSSSSATLIEAMAATSAVPGLVGRVEINVDGKDRLFADGNVVANSPLTVALNEARRLYPNRPLGVVMSIRFDQAEDHFASRAIAIAKLSHPNLHYQRICPAKVFKHDMAKETDLAKIAKMEEEAHDFIINDIGCNRLLDVSLQKLFDPNRSKKKWNKTDVTKDYRKSIRNGETFKRRTQERLSILTYGSSGMNNIPEKENGKKSNCISALCCFGRNNNNYPTEEFIQKKNRISEVNWQDDLNDDMNNKSSLRQLEC